MPQSRLPSFNQSKHPSARGELPQDTGYVTEASMSDSRHLEPIVAVQPDCASVDLLVASYNIHKCVGTDGKFDPSRTAAVIAELGADIVALQEVDRRFGRRTGLLDPAMLEQRTGLVPLPVSELSDGLGWHGNALLVRPGTAWQIQRLALPGAEPRGAVIAELTLPGAADALRVVAAHLGLLRRCRTRQVEAIIQAMTLGADHPTLVLGDLNEWRFGRARSALRAFEQFFGPITGTPPSFPSRRPLLALDKIFGCARARVWAVEAHDSSLARVASDHLPMKARVRLGPSVRSQIRETREAA